MDGSVCRLHPYSLCLVFCLGFLSVASAGESSPTPPSTGTYADFYVSWNDGDDGNPGTFEKPFKTPNRAIGILRGMSDPSGKIVLIRGGTYRFREHGENKMKIKDLHGTLEAPVQIRGYPGETVILDAFMGEFDPLSSPFFMWCGWGGVAFNNSSHVVLENIRVMGRCHCNIELLDSSHITIRYVESMRSDQIGLFAAGSYHHLTIECCRFYEQIYGNTTSHGIYISGGHWNPNLPPVRDITIRHVECFYNGRHGIQFNGRIENVVVEHCSLHHNVLGGLSLIGVRNAFVHKNLIYKNNKQGIILYTYFDKSYWDPNDPASVEHWKATHWTCENVLIRNNTIFMDDTAWYTDAWVCYDPCEHACIYIVDTSGLLDPFKNIWINNNLLYNHSNMMINVGNYEFLGGVRGISNCFYSEPHSESVAWWGLGLHSIAFMEANFPHLWKDNQAGHDPRFLKLMPTNRIDCTCQAVDFSAPALKQFPDDLHLESTSQAWDVKAGAFTKNYTEVSTLIDMTEPLPELPWQYGHEILEMIFAPGVHPAFQTWFMHYFYPCNPCLTLRCENDTHERICFMDLVNKRIAYAILNATNEPIELTTRIHPQYGTQKFTDLCAIYFDSFHDIRKMEELQLANKKIQNTLGGNTLCIFLVAFQ